MKISDAEIPSLLFDVQSTDPAAPPSGFGRLFTKADGVYFVDDDGAVVGPFGAGALDPPRAGASRRATQSVSSGGIAVIQFDTELYDSDGIVNVSGSNPSRMVIQTAGLYDLRPRAVFPTNSTGYRLVGAQVNGSSSAIFGIQKTDAVSGSSTILTGSAEVELSAGDYAELVVIQNSGSTLSIGAASDSCALTVRRIADLAA